MKIAAAQQDYLRIVDSAQIKPSISPKQGEARLDPLSRPIEQTPVEATRPSNKAGNVQKKAPGPDVVNISSEAQSSVISQAKIEEMMQQKLAEVLDAASVDLSGHQGLDYSPDAVSQRIVDFSISLYGVFREQNISLTEKQAMTKFESTIRGAVDSGFSDAMKALEAVDLPTGVADMGQQTRSLVSQRLDEYFRSPPS